MSYTNRKTVYECYSYTSTNTSPGDETLLDVLFRKRNPLEDLRNDVSLWARQIIAKLINSAQKLLVGRGFT